MATFDFVRDMYDMALKPRMLRSLTNEWLPNEKQPFRDPSLVSTIVSTIKTHRLLSESVPEPVDKKLAENWKSAFDSWMERLLLIVSSSMPDTCWIGVCLIGVTSQECSSERLLASYSIWFDKLLALIQLPENSYLVKVASCLSISDILTRLAKFPNVKKDGSSYAGRSVQPVLRMLIDDNSETVWEAAVHLLCIVIISFPSSVYSYYGKVEAAIITKMISGKCSTTLLKNLAYCLAQLPKSRGDGDTWSLMLQKVLISINSKLNDIFQDLEEETKRNEVFRLLVSPGKELPPPLGGQTMPGVPSISATKESEQLAMSIISTLMRCSCTLLTSPYPVQVAVPIQPLLALVRRVLVVDGSLSQGLFPFMTAMQQQTTCLYLPLLHLYSLELLTATIKSTRSQLLPYVADIARLLSEYLKKCTFYDLKIKVYSVIRNLLISMGAGITVYISQAVVNGALVDLDSIYHECVTSSSAACAFESTAEILQPSPRKRKRGTGTRTESLVEQPEKIVSETPTSLKIAAMGALEALLMVGCASRYDSWRPKVDHLLITVARNACKGRWSNEMVNGFARHDSSSTWEDFQLASLRALLASLLSPACVRPPYLAEGLELFCRGKQEACTGLASFCAQALLALEVLIHPRARSLAGPPTANHDHDPDLVTGHRFLDNFHPPDRSKDIQSPGSMFRAVDSLNPVDDDLYHRWFANGDRSKIPNTPLGKNTGHFAEHSSSFRDGLEREVSSTVDAKNSPAEQLSGVEVGAPAGQDVSPGRNGDGAMIESPRVENFGGIVNKSIAAKPELGRVVLDGDEINGVERGALMRKENGAKMPSTTTLLNEKGSGELVPDMDNESSVDSFPDIVDADPDSD